MIERVESKLLMSRFFEVVVLNIILSAHLFNRYESFGITSTWRRPGTYEIYVGKSFL